MRTVLFILAFVFSLTAKGNTYYVSNAGNNANNGLTTGTSWRTLSKVQSSGNAGTIVAGDSVLFNRGDSWYEFLHWWSINGGSCQSGTNGNPIYFGAYGTGAKPNFAFPIANPTADDSRNVFEFLGIDWIVCENLSVMDTVVQGKILPANTTSAFLLGGYPDVPNTNNVIRNCRIDNVGLGITVTGSYNTFLYDTITDLKNVQNTPIGTDDDYGSNSYTLTGSHNIIMFNYLSGAWSESLDYGWNGGCFEMFDECDSNIVMYNTIVDCGGVSEYGAFADNVVSSGNVYAYNKIINVGGVAYVNVNGTFDMEPDNLCFFNNVIIENDDSRFSGPNTGAGNTQPVSPEADQFSFNGSPIASVVYNLRNNIFSLVTGIDVARSSSASKITHQNNFYRLLSGGTLNYTLGGSELQNTTQIWIDTSLSTNPALWDYRLVSTADARGLAQSLASQFSGYGVTYNDYSGQPVTSPYDAGILQYVVPPVYRNTYSKKNKRYQNAP
jgi:hypothetical protein